MNCQECEELFEDMLDRKVREPLRRRMDLHLTRCAECRESLERRRSNHVLLFRALNSAQCAKHLPEGFADRLVEECRRQQPRWRRFALPRWALIAASVVAMAGFVFAAAKVAELAAGGGAEASEPAIAAEAQSPDEAPVAIPDFGEATAAHPTAAHAPRQVAEAPAVSTGNTSTQAKGDTLMRKVKAAAAAFIAAISSASFSTYASSGGDGYIESEGDAFVSLGHCAGPNTKLEVDFQLTEVELNTKPFGNWGNNTTVPMFSLYIGDPGNGTPAFSWDCTDSDGNRMARNFDTADLNRHVISFDAVTRTYNSENVGDGGSTMTHVFDKAVSGLKSTYPLAVFCRAGDKPATQAGHFAGATKMKVFGVKIWESGTLVKTYTPCLKGGVPGLKVTGPGVNTFVTGIDVSKVKYGGNILVEKDDPHVSTAINDVTAAAVSGKCIFLNTGYTVKPSSRIELDFAPLTPNTWTSGNKYAQTPEFMSAKGPARSSPRADNLLEIVGRNSTGYIGYKVGYSDYHDFPVPLSTAYGIRRTVSADAHSIALITAGYTNDYATISANWGIETQLTTTPLYLATANQNNDFAPMKIYGLRIFESGTLIKDYRPMVANGEARMVDVMNPSDVRYASTYGAGSSTSLMFEPGGNFACTDGSDEAYLEFGGPSEFENRINTGIVATKDSVIEADFALWNAKNPPSGQQHLIVQDGSDGILAWLYINSENRFSYLFKDYTDNSAVNTGISATNARRQFKFDGPNAKFTISEGGSVIYDTDMTGDRTRTGGSTTLKIGNANACMRLYGFKVTTAGMPVRDFVPYSTNGVAGLYDLVGKQFYPLAGSRVSGATRKGQEFQVPLLASMRLRRNTSGTLTCLAAGAQRYEWYEDGVLLGETSDSLTIDWIPKRPHERDYTVVPVYTVFGETVKGEAATSRVSFDPLGMEIVIR